MVILKAKFSSKQLLLAIVEFRESCLKPFDVTKEVDTLITVCLVHFFKELMVSVIRES